MLTYMVELELEINEEALPAHYITGAYLPADIDVWTRSNCAWHSLRPTSSHGRLS